MEDLITGSVQIAEVGSSWWGPGWLDTGSGIVDGGIKFFGEIFGVLEDVLDLMGS